MNDDPSHPHQQQIVALADLLGVLIGVLRADRIITADQAEAIFQTADFLLPESEAPLGSLVLAKVRSFERNITPSPPNDA